MFSNIQITPFYGARESVLQWTWSGAPDLPMAVYKSPSGLSGSWRMLPTAGNVSLGAYLDPEGPIRDEALAETWYRLSAWDAQANAYIDSQPVSLLEQIGKAQYMMLRRFLQQQYLQMRLENGFQVFHLVRSRAGVLSDATDPVTDMVGGDCLDPDAAGQRFSPGYGAPCPTFISTPTALTRKSETAQDGLGQSNDIRFAAVMLAWPTPSAGDILVHPATDRRWIVNPGGIQTDMFMGVYPTTHKVEITLLPVTDKRYRIEVPELPALPPVKHMI